LASAWVEHAFETAVWAGFIAFGLVVVVAEGAVVVALGVVVVVVVLGVVAVCAMALTLKSATKAAVVNIVAIRMGLFLR
jgi:hypothetical protein